MSQANYYLHSALISEGLFMCLQPWLFPSCLFITVVAPGLCFHLGWQPLSSEFLAVLFIWWWDLVSCWWSDIIMGLVSAPTTAAAWSCRSWFHTFHCCWVGIRICTSIKITSWCRAWLIACDKDLLGPYISRVGFKCLAGMGMLASSLHWASSHLASWEEEVTAWRGQHGLGGWKSVSAS